jgi:hypothetical protein
MGTSMKRIRSRRIAQIDFALFQCCDQCGRKRIYVHFESHCQRRARVYPRSYASQFCAFNCLVKLKRVTPKKLHLRKCQSEMLAGHP